MDKEYNSDSDYDYDPEGGHTRAEAEAAYKELFRELHGEDIDENTDPGAYSLSTQMAYEYLRRGILPDRETASRLCADIISDTDMFRADGTKQADRLAAAALANIADIDIEEFALEMGSSGVRTEEK